MLLASVSGIRNDLGFDDMTDINAAISMALHATEPLLAATLNTSFARAEVTDTFWVPEPTVQDGPHVKTEFWLSRGLIADAPVATVPDQCVSGAMNYDLEKGIARDWQTRYVKQYVSFTYQAGFETDADDDQSYKLDQVPNWLKEAAKLQALIDLADAPAVTEAGIKIETKTLQRQLQAMMLRHIRYAPMALYPL